MTTNIIKDVQTLATRWLNEPGSKELATELLNLLAKHEAEERIEQMYRNEPDYSRYNPW